jgi:hypothetical protein
MSMTALLPPDVLDALVRSLRETMPFIHTGQVVIELNYSEGRCMNAYVGYRAKQSIEAGV